MRRPLDTSEDSRRRQLDAYRAMTPEQRLQLADEMSADVADLAASGARARRDWTSSDLPDAATGAVAPPVDGPAPR